MVHARHERPLDHRKRPSQREPGLLGILLDPLGDALRQRVRQAFIDRPVAPGEVGGDLLRPAPEALCQFDQALGRIRAPVEQHVLDRLAQLLRNVLIDR